MGRKRWIPLVGVVAGLLIGGGTAHAAASIRILPIGVAVEHGAAAKVLVRVACDPVGGSTTPLEALVTLSQDDQTIAGEGGITSIVCDGTPRFHVARIGAYEGAFHRGTSYASAFVLVCHEESAICEQAQHSRNVFLVGPV